MAWTRFLFVTCITSLLLIGTTASEITGGPDLDFIPNDGDIEVVEGKGGNYKFVEEDNVLILTRENFHYFVMSRPIVLVEFYAPWCGHCQRLAPEYAKAAEKLKMENITLAKVDASKEAELGAEFMITGYPTMVLFRNGKKTEDYDGEHNSYAIVDYMKEKMDPNWKPSVAPVLVLTSQNFSSTVSQAELILVEFYAAWCKHCKQMEPEYEAAARALSEYGIPLAKVDGPSEQSLASSYNIAGFPTLLVFRKGRRFEYKGARERQGIIDYMREMARLPSKLVASVKELKNGLDRLETSVVGFFPPKSDLYNEYIAAAQELRGIFTLMHTFDEEVMAQYNVKPDTILVLQPEIYHSSYEKPTYELNKASANAGDILAFIRDKSVPLVGQRTKRNEAFKYSSRPLLVFYYDANFNHQYVKDTQFIRKKVLEVAKVYQNSNMKIAICNEDEYAEELRSVGLADATEDIKVAAYDGKLKFRMEPNDDIEPDEVHDFIKRLSSGNGKAYFKSQPIPKVQEGPVLTVVADSFANEVMEPKKDILIEIYAPWCGHCKALEPEYKKLAKKLKKTHPNLIVAKIDGTANDINPIFGDLKGFPSIFFLPVAHKHEPVPYSDAFDYKSLKAFVDQQSSVFLTDEERAGQNKPSSITEALGDESVPTIGSDEEPSLQKLQTTSKPKEIPVPNDEL